MEGLIVGQEPIESRWRVQIRTPNVRRCDLFFFSYSYVREVFANRLAVFQKGLSQELKEYEKAEGGQKDHQVGRNA